MSNWDHRGDLSGSSTGAVTGYVVQWIDGARKQIRQHKNEQAALDALDGAMHDVIVLATRIRKIDAWWNDRSRWRRAIDAWNGNRPDGSAW